MDELHSAESAISPGNKRIIVFYASRAIRRIRINFMFLSFVSICLKKQSHVFAIFN